MATGCFNADGDPNLDIEVLGVFNQPTKITCLVDTGFSGFLLLPILQAFPIGLVLNSTMDVTFANGETETRLCCLGLVRLDGRDAVGLILVDSRGGQAIVGIEFLKKFGFRLIVCPTTGELELQGPVEPPSVELPTPAPPTA